MTYKTPSNIICLTSVSIIRTSVLLYLRNTEVSRMFMSNLNDQLFNNYHHDFSGFKLLNVNITI